MSAIQQSEDFPEVVFLGVCERAKALREGDFFIFRWNIMGLRNVVLQYIYPLSMNGWSLFLAMRKVNVGDSSQFRLSKSTGEIVGTISVNTEKTTSEAEFLVAEKKISPVQMPDGGWTPIVLNLGEMGWVIHEPGDYHLEHIVGDRVFNSGTIHFGVINPPDFVPERLAAIRSNPKASKVVHFEFSCKTCSSKFRAYAALERHAKSEEDGYMWYSSVPSLFECECGKTKMDTQYIKGNLYGLLGREVGETNETAFLPLYEKSSLVAVRNGLAKLIEENPREEMFQTYLQDNPILLHQFPSDRILHKPPILTKYVADFGILTPQKELILIELEKSSTRLMKKDGGMAAPLTHAFDQVRDWLFLIKDHRSASIDSMGLEGVEVSKIRGVVIAGKDSGYDARNLRQLKGADMGEITFLTYDDLVFSMDALIQRFDSL